MSAVPSSPLCPSAVNRRAFLQRTVLGATGLCLVGRRLPAETSGLHIVTAGDTLSALARRYDTSVEDIQVTNQLADDRLAIGQTLHIPNPGQAPRPILPQGYTSAVRQLSEPLRRRSRDWRHIVLHHSAADRGNADAFDVDHRRRGMANGLAYHFVIGNGKGCPDGEIQIGSRWLRQLAGGHVRRSAINETGIGICLVGNFERYAPTPRQLGALEELMRFLQQDFLTRPAKVLAHQDLDQTLCPGRRFPATRLKRVYSA
ncbi:MAG TPA: N-acetylmuramoyl-L-alanine amidase [Kiritimatiellia bacterium]|nr:N-acetylmuramoyl-L-alanine amidase [Kiritimatiellia bacterium]HMP00443.1 N-acetylmuramoyl-L-alanine amidase [Kiritimatiellia bacterium]